MVQIGNSGFEDIESEWVSSKTSQSKAKISDFDVELWICRAEAQRAGETPTAEEIRRRAVIALMRLALQNHLLTGEDSPILENFSDPASDPLEILLRVENSKRVLENERLLKKFERSLPVLSKIASGNSPAKNIASLALFLGKRKETIQKQIEQELALFELAKLGQEITLPQLELF
jgi:hypothetical protein